MTDQSGPVFVGAWVDPLLKRELAQAAIRADRSTSAEIRIALREHLGLRAEDEPERRWR